MNKFESLVYWLMAIPRLPILVLFSLSGIFIGSFLVIKPLLAIEFQKRFYALINWRIEPISLEKEVRNTRIMGWILIVLCLIVLLLILSNSILT